VDSSLLRATLEVLLINIVLSGDNAVVIGMAARGLAGAQRRQAILLGGILAVVLRLALTIPAEQALHVPLLGAAGGLLLAWVAYRLLTSETEVNHRGAESVRSAVRLMVLADVTMSLDNVLAVAAIAEGTAFPGLVLLFGLALSIPLVLLGGGLIATVLGRFPWLAWLGAAILAVTAANLIVDDVGVHGRLAQPEPARLVIAAFLTGIVLGLAWRATHRAADPC
jgi:YjbE family integral membrane protein